MLPNLIAGHCLSIEIPDCLLFLYGKAVMLLKWFAAEIPNDGQTVASVVFALNASFASIDSFSQGIMRSLKESLQRRLEKYDNGQWKNPVGSDNTGSNLKLREEVNNIAEEVLSIQNSLPVIFGKIARFWKWVMGICAATCLVMMAMPYCARLLLLLALPVPLFALACHLKKNSIKKSIVEIDGQYDQISSEHKDCAPVTDDNMLERIGKLEKAVSELSSSDKTNPAKTKRRRKQTKQK